MFTEAAKQYWDLNCSVGGGTAEDKGKIHGSGCLLTSHHIVTARHVWTDIRNRYRWPVVLKHDGLYRCDIVHESAEADVLFLRCVEQVDVRKHVAPTKYPNLLLECPRWGLSVGFLTTISLKDSVGEQRRYKSFSQGSISMLMKDADSEHPKFALDSGIIQEGSSGGPVFTAEGGLVGVIVESLQFVADQSHPLATIVTLPIMSALYRFCDIIGEIQKGDRTGDKLKAPG